MAAAPVQQTRPNLAKPVPLKPSAPVGLKKKTPWLRWVFFALIAFGLWRCFGPSDNLSQAHQETIKAVKILIDECKLDRARQEATTLRKPEPERYRDLVQSMDAAKPACDNKRQHEQDWLKTQSIAHKAISDSRFDKATYDKASGRVQWFQKHWSEDEASRELKTKLDSRYARLLLEQAENCMAEKNIPCVKARINQWEKLKPEQGRDRVQVLQAALADIANITPSPPSPRPTTSPKPTPTTGSPTVSPAATIHQQVNKLLADAQAEMNYGNYKGASDKLELCLTMIDKGNPACTQLKKKADQLNKEMLRCVNAGNEWMSDHCTK